MNIYREFMKSLKKHWKAVLPHVRPLTQRRGTLSMASSFYAGQSAGGVHVYLEFQTHSNIAGRFTINVFLTRDELSPTKLLPREPVKLIGEFCEGPTRIGRFVKTRLGDKWWELCRNVTAEELGRRLGMPSRKHDWWYPKDYEDTAAVVRDAVADVTFTVHLALTQLGFPGAVSPTAERLPS